MAPRDAGGAEGAEGGGEDAQVMVSFRAAAGMPAALRVAETAFALPASLTRFGLSEVVNHLLSLPRPVPFDFLVQGAFVRGSLSKVLQGLAIGQERTVEVEYVTMLPKPDPSPGVPHDDWVAGVDARAGGAAASCSYDGAVRLVKLRGEPRESSRGAGAAAAAAAQGRVSEEVVATFTGPRTPLSSVALLRSSADEAYAAVAGGKDGRIYGWGLVPEAGGPEGGAWWARPASSGRPHVAFTGVQDGDQCLAAAPPGEEVFASGAADGLVRLWAAPPADFVPDEVDGEEEEGGGRGGGRGKAKRRKVASASAARDTKVVECIATLRKHGQTVTGVCWPAASALYSVALDGVVRKWDAEAQAAASEVAASRALSCVDSASAPGASPDLLAAGSTDGHVRVFDLRAGESTDRGSLLASSLASHAQHVRSIAFCRGRGELLASASYDGTVKVWDLRARVPLHTLTGHEGKVLSVDWVGDTTDLVSGGADKKLLHWQVAPSE